MIVASCQRLLAESNTEICVELENHRIERVAHTKSFSLTIDGRPSWVNYINPFAPETPVTARADPDPFYPL